MHKHFFSIEQPLNIWLFLFFLLQAISKIKRKKKTRSYLIAENFQSTKKNSSVHQKNLQNAWRTNF